MFDIQLAASVQKLVRDVDGGDFRDEKVMRTERDDFDDFAFDVYGAVRDEGTFDLRGGQGGEPCFGEFIDVAAGFHAAPIRNFRLFACRQIDDEFSGG